MSEMKKQATLPTPDAVITMAAPRLAALLIFNAVLTITAIILILFGPGSGAGRAANHGQDPMELASALMARGLNEAALDELDHYRRDANLPPAKEADLLYRMGKIADDQAKDCKRALPYYALAEAKAPEAEWVKDSGKRSVVCMDQLGKEGESRALLDQLTGGPAPAPVAAGGPVVAILDGHSVTWAEVEAFGRTVGGAKASADLEARKDLVRDYLATVLLYEDALRKGYDRDDNARRFLDWAQKEALARYHLKASVGDPQDEAAAKKFMDELLKSREVRVFNDAVPAP